MHGSYNIKNLAVSAVYSHITDRATDTSKIMAQFFL
jgi:hypothetical protein